MPLDPDSCYRALLARDPRFDGLFFVGVTTTRIYCRPVCTARTPGRDRCQFYPSAAAAEQARFRPCMRCRPELAPGQAPIDSPQRTALQAAARIAGGALADGGLDDLAAELGIGTRQLRRITREFLGASPVELAQTQRLLLAKQLLTETRLPVIDVALASGFGSLRRFNALFRSSYRLTPRQLRRTVGRDVAGEPLRLTLAYRPPLAWQELLGFLAARAIPGVERVQDDAYMRSVALGRHVGWVKVSPHRDRPVLTVEVSRSLLRSLSELMARLRNLFDLNARPDVIGASLARDKRLRATVRRLPGLRVPGGFDGFEVAWRAIIGQQNSVRAATTIAGRLAESWGAALESPVEGLDRLSPTAHAIAVASPSNLQRLGLTTRRAETLVALAQRVVAGQLRLEAGSAPEEMIAALLAVPGVGDWTAQYIALRALRWPDAFPAGDLVLKRQLGGSQRHALLAAEPWRPWRAYGAMYTWMMHNGNGQGG